MPADEIQLPPGGPAVARRVDPRPRIHPGPPPPLIGEWLTRPLHLLWIAALPQALAILFNNRAYCLMSGEMSGAQRTICAWILAAQGALLFGGAGLARWRKTLPRATRA